MTQSEIVIQGAREHNLRNVSLTLPKNRLIVMTGVSGSGKSSLAFDTLYAEGQRRYVESLSTYARQFIGQLPKPNVDSISGLAPSISIQQKSTSRNPRSTVGTITEIYDYLRVLFARVGQGYCYVSGKPIRAQSSDQIIDSIATLPEGSRFSILAPVVQNQKGEFADLFEDLRRRGYLRARVDGEVVSLNETPALRRHHKHTIEVVVDRLVSGSGVRSRLAEAVEQALKLADGRLICAPAAGVDETARSAKPPADRMYSAHYACPESGMSYEPPSPQLFSFNSPLGMCTDCAGLGLRHGFRQSSIVVSEKKSVRNGALLLLPSLTRMGRWPRHILTGAAEAIEKMTGMESGSLLRLKWQDVPEKARQLWLYGTGEKHITFTWKTRGGAYKHGGTWEGWVNRLLSEYRSARNPMRRRQLEKHMEVVRCPACDGERLNRQARNVKLTTTGRAYRKRGGPTELSLPQICRLSIGEAAEFFESLRLDATGRLIAEEALKEIRGRLGFLIQCGLHYLTLERSAPTLSGGESQRIRLAGQIGCGLVGVLYILDEPSIGLHPRDNTMLLESLQRLRDQGNTVIVVEHDEETMLAADHVIDFGPGPGIRGGEVVVEGTVADVRKNRRSLTGRYLSGRAKIEIPSERRAGTGESVIVHGAAHNNLRGIDVEFPLGKLICVTGVSGSGKSSLTNDILWQVLNRDVNRGNGTPGQHDRISGLEHIDKAIDIDQSPIGRTPRSNPATYVSVFDEIRKLYSRLPASKKRGYKPGRFSFNTDGGRCEACEGHGAKKLEMDFLADIWIPCDVCGGKRFSHETLEVKYNELSIADVLNLEVGQALEVFENIPKINRLLQTLKDVGLDYMQLGQPSPTLSGGEAQRIKLARELGKRSTGRTLYLLDEPTTGLHFADVHKLLDVLHGFADDGNTVVVVEHNLDVIKTADWVIDIGPEGGAGGGEVVCAGTPEDIAACRNSFTGKALRSVLPGGKSKTSARRRSRPAKSRAPDEVRSDRIEIAGAAEHNLQNVSIQIPRNRMSVFCGPSGSGKTSLAMDTLYAEGQRRYVESLSAYARQFLGQMPKPKVERIKGLSPAIAIEQKTVGSTPRSTVGTVTEIYDYLRVLFARLGTLHCPECGAAAAQQTTDEIVESVMSHPAGTRMMILAPIEVSRSTPYATAFQRLSSQGWVRVRVDGETHSTADPPDIDHRRTHNVEIVVDRITVAAKDRGRISDSVEAALNAGRGVILLVTVPDDRTIPEPDWPVSFKSLVLSCFRCDRSFERPAPQQFSFNSPLGWCPACEGLGTEFGANQSLLVSSPEESLQHGAVAAWNEALKSPEFRLLLFVMADRLGIPADQPWYRLSADQQRLILYGTGETRLEVTPELRNRFLQQDSLSDADTERSAWFSGARFSFTYRGLFPTIELAARLSYSHRKSLSEMAGEKDCSLCSGSRLRPVPASVQLGGLTLPQVCRMPLAEALSFLKKLRLSRADRQVAGDLLDEAAHRLGFLVETGLQYLTLNRSMPTLSGGESQRIRLAGQIGRSLTGVLYVLDEPTIGLHPRDNGRLLGALNRLKELGNTVLLVEHDREVLQAADRLYDFGPGAGRLGGSIVAEGSPAQLKRMSKLSPTGGYLSNKRSIPIPPRRRATENGFLELSGASHHNLRNVDLRIPLGTLTCITGVSGSGKSSLMTGTLAPAVARALNLNSDAPGAFRELTGVELLSRLVVVDQNPIGNTPASNPATYSGVFDRIRDLFSKMPEARVRGFGPGRFSFNRSGGRCEECDGMGQKKIEMHFLPDVWVECTGCRGRRYNSETLKVRFNDRSIADVLEMPIEKAMELFEGVAGIREALATLNAIGLGYLTLGQSAPTLSGGEAQRLKLAAELSRTGKGRSLYLLDEPTTGLHFEDITRLLSVLNGLVEQGHTVVVIEHNLDVIKTADWIVDLGPEAGSGGGLVVASGTPEDVVQSAKSAGREKRPRSWTGELLSEILEAGDRGRIEIFDVATERQAVREAKSAYRVSDTELPWEKDGRRWHTKECLSHDGQRCRWDGTALEFVVDILGKKKQLDAVNWNHRSTVEICARNAAGWFLHARTGHAWLLNLCFRVRKHAFTEPELSQRLNLTPIDDIEDLHYYSQSPRVKVRNTNQAWQEVTIKVWKKDEIDTAEFRTFLDEAVKEHIAVAVSQGTRPADLKPWRKLGEKWHLLKKDLANKGRIDWNHDIVESVLNSCTSHFSDCTPVFSARTKVKWSNDGGATVAELHTKKADGLHLVLFCPADSVTVGAVAEFGDEQEIRRTRSGLDSVRIRFRTKQHAAQLRKLLQVVDALTGQ